GGVTPANRRAASLIAARRLALVVCDTAPEASTVANSRPAEISAARTRGARVGKVTRTLRPPRPIITRWTTGKIGIVEGIGSAHARRGLGTDDGDDRDGLCCPGNPPATLASPARSGVWVGCRPHRFGDDRHLVRVGAV